MVNVWFSVYPQRLSYIGVDANGERFTIHLDIGQDISMGAGNNNRFARCGLRGFLQINFDVELVVSLLHVYCLHVKSVEVNGCTWAKVDIKKPTKLRAAWVSGLFRNLPDDVLVEAPGVEPGSENTPPQASTCVFLITCLSRRNPSRTKGPLALSSWSFAGRRQEHRGAIPCSRRPHPTPWERVGRGR